MDIEEHCSPSRHDFRKEAISSWENFMENKDITRRLAGFIVKTKYDELPPAALESAKMLIMDTLGCGIAGYFFSEKEVAPVIKLSEEIGGKEECTFLVSGKRSSWFNAILVNGTLMHSIDFDDTRPSLSTHIGTVLVPSILAMGEKIGASGKDALLAVVLGYEVVYRVAVSIMPSHYHFWHSTGTNGTFGGAAVAGKLLGLNLDEMERSLGIAADQASGLKYCVRFGDLTKSLHGGLTAAKGVLSAMLVRHGATGPKGILEYATGYCNAYSREPRPEKILDGIGKSFDIVNNAPKFYPTIVGSHCAIAATLKLVNDNDISVDDILRVDNKTFKTNATNTNPETVLAARLSTPYCMAVAILDREVGMKQFEHKRVHDPKVKALIEKIHLEVDPDLDKFKLAETGAYPAKITITTKNGRVYSAEEYYAKGVPKNPASIEELEEKFRSLCSCVFDQKQIQEIIDTIRKLDALDNISQLTKRLVKG